MHTTQVLLEAPARCHDTEGAIDSLLNHKQTMHEEMQHAAMKIQKPMQGLTLLIHHKIEPISTSRKQVVLQGSRAVVCVHNVAGRPAGHRSKD